MNLSNIVSTPPPSVGLTDDVEVQVGDGGTRVALEAEHDGAAVLAHALGVFPLVVGAHLAEDQLVHSPLLHHLNVTHVHLRAEKWPIGSCRGICSDVRLVQSIGTSPPPVGQFPLHVGRAVRLGKQR
ncbi:hypothetical protein ANANG_G00205250 [Anguilla anguilla]|uniref:Uncharacterized protein n=1 Tax=Anguilla anguilla TaxID=7936 RepID=A0A9D3M2G7_ANGAN|nr:hypothetical protein ANANG_G00205250 [Anguilla anguilla]